jgi:hypothetical protein
MLDRIYGFTSRLFSLAEETLHSMRDYAVNESLFQW